MKKAESFTSAAVRFHGNKADHSFLALNSAIKIQSQIVQDYPRGVATRHKGNAGARQR
jgi:hypothetical protein